MFVQAILWDFLQFILYMFYLISSRHNVFLSYYPNNIFNTGNFVRLSAVYSRRVLLVPPFLTQMLHVCPKRQKGAKDSYENFLYVSFWPKSHPKLTTSIISRAITRDPATQMCYSTTPPPNPPPTSDQVNWWIRWIGWIRFIGWIGWIGCGTWPPPSSQPTPIMWPGCPHPTRQLLQRIAGHRQKQPHHQQFGCWRKPATMFFSALVESQPKRPNLPVSTSAIQSCFGDRPLKKPTRSLRTPERSLRKLTLPISTSAIQSCFGDRPLRKCFHASRFFCSIKK